MWLIPIGMLIALVLNGSQIFDLMSNVFYMFILILPAILLVWFLFTPTWELVCYKLMGLIMVQPPLKKSIGMDYDGVLHDFGYRGMDHKLKTDTYKMNAHIQFNGSNNCHGCGGNAWQGNKCSFCGGER